MPRTRVSHMFALSYTARLSVRVLNVPGGGGRPVNVDGAFKGELHAREREKERRHVRMFVAYVVIMKADGIL